MTTSSATRRLFEGMGAGGSGLGVLPLWPTELLIVVAVGFGSSASADEWPVARGNAAGTAVAATALPDEPAVLWKYKLEDGSFEAEPIVAGGVVYLGDVDGTFHAVKLAGGELVWKKTFEDSGFASAATVDGDRLYVGDIFGTVRCLAIKDGEELWSFDAETEVYGGPKLFEGKLLVTTEGGVLFALDAASGEEQWKFTIDAPLRCSPTIVDGHTLLAGCDERLHVVSLATGQEVGSVEIGGPTGSSVAAVDGAAYFGNEGGVFFAVDTTNAAEPNVVWRFQDPRRGQGIRTAATVGKAVVVYGSNGKAVYGVNRETGEAAWTKPTRSRVESSPVIAGGAAVAATTRGRLMLLGLEDGEVIWEYDAGGGFPAAPAVVAGKLLIANSDGTLYCFGGPPTR
ncbi:MAG: PQQ-binding-like beta-propeller repeat protein [Planctomycetota bacterium]